MFPPFHGVPRKLSTAPLHVAGDLLKYHPHVHSIAVSGVVDGECEFHALPDSVDTDKLFEVCHYVVEFGSRETEAARSKFHF